jgi:hypothetical protein
MVLSKMVNTPIFLPWAGQYLPEAANGKWRLIVSSNTEKRKKCSGGATKNKKNAMQAQRVHAYICVRARV